MSALKKHYTVLAQTHSIPPSEDERAKWLGVKCPAGCSFLLKLPRLEFGLAVPLGGTATEPLLRPLRLLRPLPLGPATPAPT